MVLATVTLGTPCITLEIAVRRMNPGL